MKIEFKNGDSRQHYMEKDVMICPVCDEWRKQKEYCNHIHDTEFISGNDNYEAWYGRGGLHKIRFWCENGHSYSLCFGFHKGSITTWWQIEGFDPHKTKLQ